MIRIDLGFVDFASFQHPAETLLPCVGVLFPHFPEAVQ